MLNPLIRIRQMDEAASLRPYVPAPAPSRLRWPLLVAGISALVVLIGAGAG